MRIGIDIGGTNTDAVLMDGNSVVASYKSTTTENLNEGVERACSHLFADSGVNAGAIRRVLIGTTHFTNAVVERRNLDRVAAIRLGAPATSAFPPFSAWPADLIAEVQGLSLTLHGGRNFDNSPISPINEGELRAAADQCVQEGITSVALTEVFSPLNPSGEELARDIMSERQPGLVFTLSKDMGNLGVLERENAAILNACLRTMAADVTARVGDSLKDLGITAPFYLSQNDGTVMSESLSAQFPVRTFASGPTNSIRGAGHLTGLTDALVVDVGGTTTDVGALRKGYPRESLNNSKLAGLRTNFCMPDVVSIGLGGGSLVTDMGGGSVAVGPRSVGGRLTTSALVFGGTSLTATDIAVAGGLMSIGDAGLLKDVGAALTAAVLRSITDAVEAVVDRVRLSADPLPIILVGGGAAIIPQEAFKGVEVIRPAFAAVANAVGSAIAHAGGESDRIYDLDKMTRDEAVADARKDAFEQCAIAGAASDTVEVIELDELPLTYLPGSSVRIRVKAAGALL